MKLSHIGNDVRSYVIDGKREPRRRGRGSEVGQTGCDAPDCARGRQAGSRTLHGIHSDFPPAWLAPFPRQPILKLSQTGQLEGPAAKKQVKVVAA